MKGLISFPKPADVDFVASLTVVLAGLSAMIYIITSGFGGGLV